MDQQPPQIETGTSLNPDDGRPNEQGSLRDVTTSGNGGEGGARSSAGAPSMSGEGVVTQQMTSSSMSASGDGPAASDDQVIIQTLRPQIAKTRGNRPRAEGRRDTGWVGADVAFKAELQRQREASAASPHANPAEASDAVKASPKSGGVPYVFDSAGHKITPGVQNASAQSSFKDKRPVGPKGAVLERLRSARDGSDDNVDGAPVELNRHNAHALNWEQILDLLDTNAETGLTQAKAQERLNQVGKNKLAEKRPEPLWHKVFRQINSPLIYILIIAAIIAGVFEEWAEMGLILGVVVINVLMGLIQEGRAEKATRALKAMLSAKANVIRDGTRMEINAEGVVPGDICFVESGNKIPADMRLIQVSNLSIQESLLTGESLPVNKKTQRLTSKLGLGDRKNMAFSATSVVKGQGRGVVVATGDETEIGRINSSVNEVKEEKTQLIKQVDAFGLWIGAVVIPIAVGSFCLAFFSPGESHHDVSNAFIEAIAIAVAVVPEGLPAIISITLAIGTKNMANHHAIVKALPSVETLGSVMVICSDKTGTLTKNEMTVVTCRTAVREYTVSEVGYDPAKGKVEPVGSPGERASTEQDEALIELARGGVLCNDSRLDRTTLRGNPIVLPVGDPTEVALVTFWEKLGLGSEQEERQAWPRLGMIPFESDYKFMVTFHEHRSDQTKARVYIKGAPDRLFSRCIDQLGPGGDLQAMDSEFWPHAATELSSRGLRCLAVCRCDIPRNTVAEVAAHGPSFLLDEIQPFLTMLGLSAIMDPPRSECVTAIQDAKEAGVTVKMITGDHPGTARAIGEALGIVDEDHPLVKTGPELDALSMAELREVVLHCNVYARASPENKIAIVRALQAERQVCSMTGDGVNDAPALRAADIGVAMGITGTDVSKDAAKMILTDDNFATILVAVKEGRRVWDNLRKLLIFNMPASFAQGGVVFFALCLQWENVPLTAIQILYVNMITACTLGLMLALEPAESDVMKRPPRPLDARLIGAFFLWRTLFVATIFIILVLGSVAWLNSLYDEGNAPIKQQHSIALNTLVFCEIFYAFNCRFLTKSSLHPRIFTGNPFAWVCAFVMVGLQFLITYVPGLNDFFSMEAMIGKAWGITILFAVVAFLIVEFEKAIGRPLKPYLQPCINRVYYACCSWDRLSFARVFCCCCNKRLKDKMDMEKQAIPQPKGISKMPGKLKSGGSLRYIPDEALQEAV